MHTTSACPILRRRAVPLSGYACCFSPTPLRASVILKTSEARGTSRRPKEQTTVEAKDPNRKKFVSQEFAAFFNLMIFRISTISCCVRLADLWATISAIFWATLPSSCITKFLSVQSLGMPNFASANVLPPKKNRWVSSLQSLPIITAAEPSSILF